MAITTINQENFETKVTQSSAPVLLDFWAAWCGPCTMLSPVVEELAQEHPEISFGKVNVDEVPELPDLRHPHPAAVQRRPAGGHVRGREV